MGIAIVLSGFLSIIALAILTTIILTLIGITPPEPNISFPLLVVLFIFLVGVFIGLLVLWYYYPEIRPNRRKRGEVPKTPLDIVLYISNEDEVKVINAISELEGGAYQFEIAHLADLHKMKVHRVVKRLLERGILRDEFFDEKKRNRKLFLADWVET
jgi:uncharacterized membrane protein